MAYMYCVTCDAPFDYPTPQEAANGNMVCECCGQEVEVCTDAWKGLLIEVIEDFQARQAVPKKDITYMIGQRVFLTGQGGVKEIGNVVPPEHDNSTGVWVFSPTMGYSSCYDAGNVEPLPNGQL